MLILRRITDLRSWYIPRHRRRNILNPGSCKRGPAIFAGFVSTYETYARSKFLLSLLLPIRTTDLSDGNKRYCFKASLRIGLKDQMIRCFRKNRSRNETHCYSPNLIRHITMEIIPIPAIKKQRIRKRTFTLRMTTSPRSSPAKRARMSRRKKRSPTNARAVHKRRPSRMEPTIEIPSVVSADDANCAP